MSKVLQEDILTLDLNRGGFHRGFIHHAIGWNDMSGNRFGMKLIRDGQIVDTHLCSCIGYFIRADGETVVVNGGPGDSENILSVTLPQACYMVEGNFTLAIKVSGDAWNHTSGTILVLDGTVVKTTTGVHVDPGTIVRRRSTRRRWFSRLKSWGCMWTAKDMYASGCRARRREHGRDYTGRKQLYADGAAACREYHDLLDEQGQRGRGDV